MNAPTPKDYLAFALQHRSRDWAALYLAALEVLGEEARDGWTEHAVTDAVRRAIEREAERQRLTP